MALIGLYLVACVLLVAAGVAKAARPGDTARALHDMTGLPALVVAVRLGAGAEALLGVGGLIYPSRGIAILVAGSYAVFGCFVLYARAKGGLLATCGCFGSVDTPPTLTHVVVDAALAASAAGVAWTGLSGWLPSLLSHQYGSGVPLVAAAALCAWLIILVLSPLTRLDAVRRTHVPLSRDQS
jgi:hypothetical protein